MSHPTSGMSGATQFNQQGVGDGYSQHIFYQDQENQPPHIFPGVGVQGNGGGFGLPPRVPCIVRPPVMAPAGQTNAANVNRRRRPAASAPQPRPMVAQEERQRRGPQPQWTVIELGVLIEAKKMEEEAFAAAKGRDKHKNSDQRWGEVHAYCLADGLQRSSNQIKKRWEKLSADFKRIWDWQRAIPSGQLGYWEMGTEEKRQRKLPLYFQHECYAQMEVWVPNHRGLNPHEHQVVDSLGEDGLHDPELVYFGAGSEDSEPTDGAESTAVDDLDAPTGYDPDLEPAATEPVSNGESQLPGGRQSTVTSPEEFNVRNGWKRSAKRSRGDETLTKITASLVEAMGSDSLKRNLHDEEFIDLEKEKLQLEESEEDISDPLDWSDWADDYDPFPDVDSEEYDTEREDGIEDDKVTWVYDQLRLDNLKEDNLQDDDWGLPDEKDPTPENTWEEEKEIWAKILGSYYLGVAVHHAVGTDFSPSNSSLTVDFVRLFAEAACTFFLIMYQTK